MRIGLSNSCETALLVDDDIDEAAVAASWSLTRRGLAQATVRGIRFTMQEYLMRPPLKYCVNMINKAKLDCRRSNMRLANMSQVALTRGPTSKSASKFKGVYLSPATSVVPWTVSHSDGFGGRVHIGQFQSEEEAAKAYDRAVVDYWSQIPDDPISGNYVQFLYLNFPEE